MCASQNLASAAPAPKTIVLPVLSSSLPSVAAPTARVGTSRQALPVTGRRLQQSSADGVQVRAIITAFQASAEEIAAALQNAVDNGSFVASLLEGGEGICRIACPA